MILELIFSFFLGMFIAAYIFYKRRHEMIYMMEKVERMIDKQTEKKDNKNKQDVVDAKFEKVEPPR